MFRKMAIGLAIVAALAVGGVILVGCTHMPWGHDWHRHDTHMHHGPDTHGYDHCGQTDYGHKTRTTHTHGTPLGYKCCATPSFCNSCTTCHSCGKRSSSSHSGHGH